MVRGGWKKTELARNSRELRLKKDPDEKNSKLWIQEELSFRAKPYIILAATEG